MLKQLLIAATVASCIAAGTEAQSASFTPWRQIASISEDAKGVVVTLAGAKIYSQSSCTNSFRVQTGGPLGSPLISGLKAAASAKKEIRIRNAAYLDRCEIDILDFETR